MLHLSLLHSQNFGIPHPDCQRMPSSHHPVRCLRHEVGYPDSENRAGQFSVSLAGEKLCNPWFQSLELTPKPENPLKHQETSHMLTFHNSEQWPKPHQESLLRDQCGWKRVSPSAAVKPRCVGILRLTQTPLTSFSSHVSIAFGFLARNFGFSEICPFHFWLQTLKTNMKPCSLFQASTVPKSPWASHQPWKSHVNISVVDPELCESKQKDVWTQTKISLLNQHWRLSHSLFDSSKLFAGINTCFFAVSGSHRFVLLEGFRAF